MPLRPDLRLYDAHAHLADARLREGLPRLLADAAAAGVGGILAAAARRAEWDAIGAISRHEPVYGALGLHPFFVDEWQPETLADLRTALRAHPRLLAVGEIGLDFQNGRRQQAKQVAVFAAQLAEARAAGLPAVFHNRRSWGEFLGVLDDLGGATGVCHCFNGSREIARAVLDRGLMVSFCGPLTYSNARRLRDAAAYVPLECILTETDCPDLPAASVRPGPSLPQHVRHILECLAEVRRQPIRDIADQVEANFHRLLGLPSPPVEA